MELTVREVVVIVVCVVLLFGSLAAVIDWKNIHIEEEEDDEGQKKPKDTSM